MTTHTLSEASQVGDWVADRPSRSRVFEDLGIDYCCGGRRTLGEACASLGLRVELVLGSLREAAPALQDRDWTRAGLAELCDHIQGTHHAYLKTELPRVRALVGKVLAAHGERHGELAQLKGAYEMFLAELEAHMAKEEGILFPMIRDIEGAASRPEFHCGTVANPIRVMIHEHDRAGEALSGFRRLTGGYVVPADGCATWRALYDALKGIESDLHMHVHKENNILFPRAVEIETGLE
jgi:regulator of cell morphogenesis and NO signaling